MSPLTLIVLANLQERVLLNAGSLGADADLDDRLRYLYRIVARIAKADQNGPLDVDQLVSVFRMLATESDTADTGDLGAATASLLRFLERPEGGKGAEGGEGEPPPSLSFELFREAVLGAFGGEEEASTALVVDMKIS